MPLKFRTNYGVLLASLCAMSSCTHIPEDVAKGERLPDTLEMCHSMLIDANDKLYLQQAEINHQTKKD